MTWLTIIAQLIGLLRVIVAEAAARSDEARKIEIDTAAQNVGRLQAISETLTDATAMVKAATDARQKFRDQLAGDPAGLRVDDGYERTDAGSVDDSGADGK